MAGDRRQAGHGNAAGAEWRSGGPSSADMRSNAVAESVAEESDRPAAVFGPMSAEDGPPECRSTPATLP